MYFFWEQKYQAKSLYIFTTHGARVFGIFMFFLKLILIVIVQVAEVKFPLHFKQRSGSPGGHTCPPVAPKAPKSYFRIIHHSEIQDVRQNLQARSFCL